MALKDSTTNPEKRVRSRTISAGGSTARDPKMFGKGENSSLDYTEISSIPPLPLYALLAADEDTLPKTGGYSTHGHAFAGKSSLEHYAKAGPLITLKKQLTQF